MGFPNIPPINPDIDIDREEVIDLLLASIGLEELSLAHLVNAEAEKLQRALGTLQIPGTTGEAVEDFFPDLIGDSLDNLLAINRSINKTLKFAMHKEFILLTKLEDIVDFAEEFLPPVVVQCECSVAVNNVSFPGVTLELPAGEVTGTLVLGFSFCDCETGASSLTALFIPDADAGLVITAELVEGSVVLECDTDEVTAIFQITVPGFDNPLSVTFVVNQTNETVTITVLDGAVVLVNEEVLPGFTVTIEQCNGNGNGTATP